VCPAPTHFCNVGKTYWNSEDYSAAAGWSGAQTWANDIIRNYVNNNMTATIAWSTIWSVLEGLPYTPAGTWHSGM
jgi:hypothetical protein